MHTSRRSSRSSSTRRTYADSRSARMSKSAGSDRSAQSPNPHRTPHNRSERRSSHDGRVETYAPKPAKVPASFFGIDLRLILAVVVVLIMLVFVARSCSSSKEGAVTQDMSVTMADIKKDDTGQEDTGTAAPSESEMAVRSVLEETYADALLEAAQTDEKAAWITEHVGSYAMDGAMVQMKILRLAAMEPAAREFVYNLPDNYPASEGEPCSSTWSGTVPQLYQWDMRWGYTEYCSTLFALTGCCPTALAMVYQGLTGKSDKSPYDMGVLASENGYMDTYNGTSTAFLTDYAGKLGLRCSQIDASSESMVSSLQSGHILICNVGPGDFTTSGHFIVLAGLDDNGEVIVNDPFSAVNSSKTWSADVIAGQTKALFAYSL